MNRRPRSNILKELPPDLQRIVAQLQRPEATVRGWTDRFPTGRQHLDAMYQRLDPLLIERLSELGLEPSSCDHFVVAALEGVANACQHGCPNTECSLEMTLRCDEHWCLAEITISNRVGSHQRVQLFDAFHRDRLVNPANDGKALPARRRGFDILTVHADKVVTAARNGEYFRLTLAKVFPRPEAR